MNQKELLELKEKIEVAKNKVTELKVRQEYLLKELKEHHHCDSINEAKEIIMKKEKELQEIEEEISNRIKILENKYM